jgi:hypothetical protein
MVTQTLWEVVRSWPGAIAVVDGMRIRDAQPVLAQERIYAQSLILDAPRRPIPRNGPWMAPVDQSGVVRLAGIPGMQQGCVLWGGPVEPNIAFQHFRRLNQSMIPSDDGEGQDRVLFRHWDSETLALIYPVLKPGQRAQLFGPFVALALYSADADMPLFAQRERDWPPPARLPIVFDADQMKRIETAMKARSDRNVARYLRRNAGPQLAGVDDAALQGHVVAWREQAGAWGATSEAGVGRFAWLQIATGGKFASIPGMHATIAQTPGASADLQLKRLMHVMVYKLRHGV